jgi:hypothetical protein
LALRQRQPSFRREVLAVLQRWSGALALATSRRHGAARHA